MLGSQLGVKNEGTYGTAVTVDRFFEFVKADVKEEMATIKSKGLRASHRVHRSDRGVRVRKGATGMVEMEVLSKGFGWWLLHMLGATGTAGPTDSGYTHTGTIASLLGDSFTCQLNKILHPAGTDQAITAEGCKVAKWSLSCGVDGLLMFSADIVAEDATTATALASASYASSAENLSWAGGAVTIGGAATAVTDFKIEVDNKLDAGRHKQRSSTLRQEPVEAEWREIKWELTADFESLTQYNRAKTAILADATAAIVATWTAPTLIGAAVYPSLSVTIDEALFEEKENAVEGPEPLQIKFSGTGGYDGSASAVTVVYVSADATA